MNLNGLGISDSDVLEAIKNKGTAGEFILAAEERLDLLMTNEKQQKWFAQLIENIQRIPAEEDEQTALAYR